MKIFPLLFLDGLRKRELLFLIDFRSCFNEHLGQLSRKKRIGFLQRIVKGKKKNTSKEYTLGEDMSCLHLKAESTKVGVVVGGLHG